MGVGVLSDKAQWLLCYTIEVFQDKHTTKLSLTKLMHYTAKGR